MSFPLPQFFPDSLPPYLLNFIFFVFIFFLNASKQVNKQKKTKYNKHNPTKNQKKLK